MNDDLDDLKAAMKAATPTPDAARKAANLALGEKNFTDLQGSRSDARPKSDRPKSGILTGVRTMFAHLSNRVVLGTTTAVVACAFVFLGPLRDLDTVRDLTLREPAREAASDAVLRLADTPKDLAEPIIEAPLIVENAPQVQSRSRLPVPLPQQYSEDQAGAPLGVTSTVINTPILDRIARPERNTEAFANADTNRVKVTREEPISTFSIDVDTASYAIARNALMSGQLPPKEAVRVEEMINYFTYDYPAPDAGQAFRPSVTVTPTPWNDGTQLLHIGIQGAEVLERPPLNLVFLIDTSGSMQAANKLPLLKQSFALMLGQLRPEDQVAIVTYAGSAGRVLDPTAASERATILAALDRLEAGGSTAGEDGLRQAYATASQMAEDGDVSRVILATDGDFNVGLFTPDALTDFIADQRDTGAYLSVLGFGRGNLDDAAMQALAQNGNGQATYIDTLSEAQKVLVDQLSGALFPIANDVKVQVEFNPAKIAEYRLIGYETRALRREDFNNDKVDAGDIGAGHQVTAIYEITPVGSPARRTDPLRYSADATGNISDELGFLRLRYKAPGASDSRLIETPIQQGAAAGVETAFASAIAGFGQLLRGSTDLGDWGWGDAIALAESARGADPFGYRVEALRLMRLAESLSVQ